jgi:hypothetical protein
VDAAAMRGLKVLWGGRVRELGAVKPFSFVPDHNRNFLIRHAAVDDVNMLVRIFMIAVNNGICQGFSQGDFNVDYASRHTSASLDKEHELVYER